MSTHPWLTNYPIKSTDTKLFLGTHPPMPYRGDVNFYYGNTKSFWKIIHQIFPEYKIFIDSTFSLINTRGFLEKNNIAITDIVYHTGQKEFSTDYQMGTLNRDQLNPKLEEWLKTSQINTIYFTSFSSGNSAKALFKRWYQNSFGYRSGIDNGHFNEIELFEREVSTIDLYSPSPNARRAAPRIREYQDWLVTHPNESFDEFRIDWYSENLNIH